MKKTLLAIFAIPVIFSSCKKDNEETCELSMSTLAGTYKLTSMRYKPNGGTESEVIGVLPACQLDDLTTFNVNGSFTYQDAGVACSPNGSYPGNWNLSGSTITIEAITGTVEGFNCTTLVYYRLNSPNPGDRYTFRYTRQ
jgi:hypothetical protein